ncbi:PAP2 superfamily protein [Desulfurobacterium atlanticum]|uniref:PAP2 superfamily protein n=1 Tax=Desulfurobacterium atlanticum TaxID=240169 RepID=A0A239AE08_9BACT|nr:PAP2 superfamily protein [Desulfurobacterium atlanticum]
MIISIVEKESGLFLTALVSFWIFTGVGILVDLLRNRKEQAERKAIEAVFYGLIFIISLFIYTCLKYTAVAEGNYHRILADIEKPVFLLVSSFHPGAEILSFFYEHVWLALNFIPPFLIVFSHRSRRRFFVTFYLLYLSSAAIYILFPVKSPVFEFSFKNLPQDVALFHSLTANDTLFLKQHGYVSRFPLYADTAFPSLHVAYTFLIYLIAPEKLKLPAFFLYLVIFAGSVLLGFHYLSDGIAGTALTLFAWKIAGEIDEKIDSLAGRKVFKKLFD